MLPEPRHDKLTDFRVLVIDTHPLCPTAASIEGALEQLIGRLAKLGCKVARSSAKMPDLAQTTRNYERVAGRVLQRRSAARRACHDGAAARHCRRMT